MQFLKRSWAQIAAQLSHLSTTAKALIVCLLVIMLMVAILLLAYAGSPSEVNITPFVGGDVTQGAALLDRRGVSHRLDGGQIWVPVGHRDQALQVLVQGDMLAADTDRAFQDLIDRQSPWFSNEQNRQAYLQAKQSVLGRVISRMTGVKSASVVVDVPQHLRFGENFVRPSASVTIETEGGMNPKAVVDAIAGLVAGAFVEMKPEHVRITDTRTGRGFTGGDNEKQIPTDRLELRYAIERDHKQKIENILQYIPGVIVAVNVLTDETVTKNSEQFQYEETEPLRRQFSREEERVNQRDRGNVGARPNTEASIRGSGGDTTRETLAETEAEFNEKRVTARTLIKSAGHSTEQVNVTVNVPRSYFVGLFRQENPETENGPDDTALTPIVERELASIERQVKPQITARADGLLQVSMVPDPDMILKALGVGERAGGGLVAMLQSDMMRTASLLGMTVLALGMMMMMVRKATQRPELPSVEELAGVPPTLPTDEDILGEVEEVDASLEGVEVDEEDLRSRRIADQISDMVKTNPEEAARIFARWVGTGD